MQGFVVLVFEKTSDCQSANITGAEDSPGSESQAGRSQRLKI